MDIDAIILSWILEFALKRSVDDSRLNSMLEAFPIPEDNYFLRKMLLLKQLESDISRNSSLSLTTLEHLEYLEELEYRRGIEKVSDAMKNAYCEVAVEYTVKYLRNEDEDGGKFCDAVKSVWTRRVRKLEKEVEKGGLGSDELFDWRLKMEAAVQDHGVRERLVKKSKQVNAVDALRAYLIEEREKRRGPSFLELVADRLKNDETLKKLLGLANPNRIEPKETVLHSVDPGSAVTNDNRALQKDAALSRKLVGKKHARVRSGNCRGAKISDSDCLEVCPGSKCNLPPTPEVNRIQEALDSSRMDLQASVKDPLPNELEFAEEVADTMRGSTDHDPIQEDHVKHNPSAMKVSGFVRANGGNPSNGPRPSLMERNSTAHTHEWDDSIENSSEESPDQGSRIKLPSPKRRHVSPLTSNGTEQPKKRRRVGKWSVDEEDALRTGVEECGEGSWKDILEKYGHRFADRRTQVDLKDKWRNMKRT